MPRVRGSSGATPRQPRSVKLLFDENVSSKLPGLLEDLYPGSAHVRDLGLSGASDNRVMGTRESKRLRHRLEGR
jgi:hypothetical protein